VVELRFLPQGVWQGLSLGGRREELGGITLNNLNTSNIYGYNGKSFFEDACNTICYEHFTSLHLA
jgi:hypothetical protein